MVDLDDFDEHEYFPQPHGAGHCCAIGLALHQLTGWPLFSLTFDDELEMGYDPCHEATPTYAHVMVLSPRGFVDLNGPKVFAMGESCRLEAVTAESIEQNYLRDNERRRVNLNLAVPVAEAVLARYFPSVQLKLF